MPIYTLPYVYQIGDFSTAGSNIAPPNESGAQAAGSPPFDIQLNTGASGIQIQVNDDDANFHEHSDPGVSQTLAAPVTIDGTTYPVGTSIFLNYVLSDGNGFEGFSITIGGSNTGNNTTTAFITNSPMVPGTVYTFTSESNVGRNPEPYQNLACFTAGTEIETPQGPTQIDKLVVGDRVWTTTHPARTVRWIGRRTVRAQGRFTPIMIKAGTLGATQDMMVSPNHRVLIQGVEAELLLGMDASLVAAKHLVNGVSVKRAPGGFVTYIHLMFDTHEIVETQGLLSESYFGDQGSDEKCATAAEARALFPDRFLTRPEWLPAQLAHPEAKAFEGKLLSLFV